MPYTVVPSVAQLPPYEDMDLTKGRTYRYYGTTKLTQTAARQQKNSTRTGPC